MRRFLFHPNGAVTFQTLWNGVVNPELTICDEVLQTQFHEEQPWGIDAAIDLGACNPALIRDPAYIQVFVGDLCEKMQLRRSGEPQLVHFDEEDCVADYTLVQLIETSDIVAHFIHQRNAVCLNVLSCSFCPPIQCAVLCQQWFAAQDVRLSVTFRGQGQYQSSSLQEDGADRSHGGPSGTRAGREKADLLE